MTGVRVAVTLANLLGVAALAAVLSYWGWRWFGPATVPLGAAPAGDVVAALAVSPPFGGAAPAAPQDVSRAAGAVAVGDPRLLGVLAERAGGGRALLRMPDGTARLATAGEALGPGTTLVAVAPDGVTLRDAAGERRLLLRAQPASGAAPPRAIAACIPPGYRGPVVRLNAELVSGLIAQPQALAAAAEAKDGALVVRDASGFAAMLGLQKGDRVTQANGIALRSPDDVVIAILRPLAASQPVRVLGQRGSEPHELLIVNASACPS